jgi:replicative DNA helicase
MQEACPSTANVAYYADMVLDAAGRRAVIRASAVANLDAFDQTEELETTMAKLESALIRVRRGQGISEVTSARGFIKPVFEEIQRAFDTGEMVTGLGTGLKDFDEMTSGLHGGEYILVAGRPGIGKSTLARNIAQHAAIENGVPVLIFSIEASSNVVCGRILASESGVLYHDMRRGYIQEADWPKLTIAASKLSEAPIYFDDDPELKPSVIRAKSQMFLANQRTGLIIVDHINDLQPDEPLQRREQELTKISLSLKATARSLNVPLIALAQLSRAVEGRPDKRPVLSDLRDTGSLEQHGDVILMLYREDYYDHTPGDHSAELLVRKQRNGPTGVVSVVYDHKADRYRSVYKRELPAREPGSDDL